MIKLSSSLVLVLLLAAAESRAQAPSNTTSPMGITPLIAQLFGDHQGFSATIHLEAETQGQPINMPGKLTFLDGQSRLAIDMSRVKGPGSSPQLAAQLQAMGMTEVVFLNSPGANYIVYPGLKAYAPTPAPAAAKPNPYTLTRTDLGEETVDGQPSRKQRVVAKNDQGEEHQATLWLAKNLKDFPVRIEFAEGPHRGKLRFEEVNFDKPDQAQLKPPDEFTRYNSAQEMMTTIMLKRFGGGLPSPPPN